MNTIHPAPAIETDAVPIEFAVAAATPPPMPPPIARPAAALRSTVPARTAIPVASTRSKWTGAAIALGLLSIVLAIGGLVVFQNRAARVAASRFTSFPALRSLADATWPTDTTWSTPETGIRSMRLTVTNGVGLPTNLIVYLPTKSTGKVPCVFVAPAGTPLFHGMALGDGDVVEQLPYARAGFAVIAYSIGGPLDDSPAFNSRAAKLAFDTFRRSQGGYADAEAAIEYALARRPEIDPARLCVAGHSSAGTLALMVAAKDERIRACCAYAPCTDIDARLAPHANMIEQAMPGATTLTHDISPMNLPAPRGRIFLFHADDDDNVPTSDATEYASRVGVNAEVVIVPTGGHYRSMIDRGIPAGIRFLQSQTETR